MSDEPSRVDSEAAGPEGGTLDRALTLVRFLRRKCPWDAKQTATSLVPHLLEESHEVVDAIHAGDGEALEGELGDLLLNLAFQIVVGEESETFTPDSIVDRLEEKMRRRHPHLYGLGEKRSWESIKGEERGADAGLLSDLPRGLDPLTRAHRVQEKVSTVGFDWEDSEGARAKVEEELGELRKASTPGEVEEELGDVLFAIVNLVRLSGHHATTTLAAANRKFEARFASLERLAKEEGITLGEADLETLDGLWERAKREERAAE